VKTASIGRFEPPTESRLLQIQIIECARLFLEAADHSIRRRARCSTLPIGLDANYGSKVAFAPARRRNHAPPESPICVHH
jgi:hypothetical protein